MNPIHFTCLLLLTVITVGSCQKPSANINCDLAERDLDRKLKKLFWIGETAQIPRTEKDLDKFCADTHAVIKNAQSYRSCLGPFPKVILNVINRQVRKFGRKICTDKNRKQESLRRLSCITKENIDKLYYCPHRAIVQLNHLSNRNSSDTQHAIASFCCIFHRTTQCAKSQVQSIRSECSVSNGGGQSSLGQLLGGLSGETTELICSRYSSVEVCERDFGEGLRKLDRVADQNQVPFKDTPIVRPLLRLADQLGAN